MTSDENIKWHSIRVDPEVFAALQRRAQPLVDTANDVLRRLLLKEIPIQPPSRKPSRSTEDTEAFLVDSATFVQFLLHDRFGYGFKSVGRYQYMFESDKELVFFQNYNQETDLLWYRVTEKARQDLSSSPKQVWLCLTNPAEKYAYIIPMSDVEGRAQRCGWSREEFEIHIYPKESRWSELDWNIGQYLYNLAESEEQRTEDPSSTLRAP